ncbi:hypothetical protein W02_37910 [Nitrospira sp. KM1]|nr:hypothetical protein W02_37910 [Nitrospira sp. KM1]
MSSRTGDGGDSGRGYSNLLLLAILFEYRIEDVSTVNATPALRPPFSTAFEQIYEVILSHAALTATTIHGVPSLTCE